MPSSAAEFAQLSSLEAASLRTDVVISLVCLRFLRTGLPRRFFDFDSAKTEAMNYWQQTTGDVNNDNAMEPQTFSRQAR